MANNHLLDSMRILIVEDEYFVALEIKETLTNSGAAMVRLSGEVSDALRWLKGERFDAALVDINLHGEMAYGVADELVRLRIPFAFATGYTLSLIPPRFGHVRHLPKPLDHSRIVAELWDLRDKSDCAT